MLLKSNVTLFNKTYKILDSFDVIFLLFLSLLFVFLLHTSFNPSILSISSIILLTPSKSFISCEIFPVIIKGKYFINISVRNTKAFIFSHFLFQIISGFKGFSFFSFDFFEYIPVNMIKGSLIIIIPFKTSDCKVLPNIETKTVLFEIFF